MTMNQVTSAKPKMPPETRRAIIKWIVQAAAGWVGYGLILFVSAGKLGWVWGWAMLIVVAIFLAAHPIILIPINPDLLAEREKGLRDRGVNLRAEFIRVEERMLEDKFGQAWLDYRRRVRRWM
jgi:protein-S-isoprenylcysteine O-methyltransferase Ste14